MIRKVAGLFFWFLSLFSLFLPSDVRAQINPRRPIIVGHNEIALFDQIPDQYITAARNIRQMFIDQSVGVNISEGLTCLSYPSVQAAPNACKRPDPVTAGLVADVKYSRENWDYFHWDSLGLSYDWPGVGYAFIEAVTPRLSQYQVFSYQYSYLHVGDSDGIHLIPGGFFYNNPPDQVHPKADIYDMEQFFSQHPDKTFILWTSSLSRIIGTRASYEFNNQMREYARSNNKILFDVADIESHAPDGRECTYNGYPAICPEYTSETQGGHLGSMSTGKIRIAKGMWVLMAQLAGWNPGSGTTSTPTPTRINTPTPVPTADANGDGRINGIDYMIWLNHYNQTTQSGPSVGDFNRSGRVDNQDYSVWLAGYR